MKIVFHAHSMAAVGLLRNIKCIPLICTIHAVNTNKSVTSKKITNLILNKILNYGYKVTAVSDYLANYYNTLVKSDKTITVLNGSIIEKNQE